MSKYLSSSVALVLSMAVSVQASDWPSWRGPDGTGSAAGSPPIHWSETKNIAWKTKLPGLGHSSPVISNRVIYLLTAIQTDQEVERPDPPQAEEDGGGGRRGRRETLPTHIYQFVALAVDQETGAILWEKVLREELPHAGVHRDASFASASPATDGEFIFANFGSAGMYALDLEGNVQWEVDLGDMTTRGSFGEGSSPVVYENTVVVNWDHEEDSFLVAFDRESGEELWRRDREENTTWATPLIVDLEGDRQVVVNGTTVRSYGLDDGEVIWESEGMTGNAVPTPILVGDLLYVTTGFRGAALQAIRIRDAVGVITETDTIVWSHDRDTPYVPSPVFHDGMLYVTKSNDAILTVFDAATGKVQYGPTRLEGLTDMYASPVAAAGHVYFFGRSGEALVLEHGPELKIAAANQLEDGFDASPAIVGDKIYLRGREHLYCIAETE